MYLWLVNNIHKDVEKSHHPFIFFYPLQILATNVHIPQSNVVHCSTSGQERARLFIEGVDVCALQASFTISKLTRLVFIKNDRSINDTLKVDI